jgi:diguanylate cyclase (GGDEF)-like protein
MANITPRLSFRSAILAVALLCAVHALPASGAPPAKPDPQQLFAEADRIIATDHARFLALTRELHRQSARLSPAQQQRLVYFDATIADQSGNKDLAIRLYNEILRHIVDDRTAELARNSLIALYLSQRKYVKAYTMANAAMEKLSSISDPQVKAVVLSTGIRVLTSQKRFDEAIKYADELEALPPRSVNRCIGRVNRTQERIYRGDSLDATRDDYQQAIEFCRSANMPGYPNGLREVWASWMVEQGHPDEAITYLNRVLPLIQKSGFKQHEAGIHVVYAEAYLKKGEFELARKHALQAVSENAPGTFNWTLQYAYSFLYKIAEHQGKYALALKMYKKHMEQYKASTDDSQAQAIAYQTVKQDVLANKLKIEELAKKNKILQLHQSLDRKSEETNRLYTTLLLLVLASIAFWAWRIKHSQVRFRKMARHDDLTGIFNRQHFFDQAERILHRLQKTGDHACLMILDMDHFKRINDAYGHVAGDMVLKHVVRTCREELRDSDLFGRLGGEEFGILMPGTGITQGTEIGERVRRSLAQSPVQVLESETVTVTSSIGLACTEEHGYAVKPLLMAADHALYGAKRGGRNRLAVHTGPSATARA